METSLLIFSDGRTLRPGVTEQTALQSLTWKLSVNPERELDFAAACAAVVEAKLLDHTGAFSTAVGDSFALYTVGEETVLTGQFRVTELRRTDTHSLTFTACDRMSLADRDLTDWLTALEGWPYAMGDFLSMVCAQCGIALGDVSALVNAGLPVRRFVGNVTGRELIRCVAGANCAWACMDPAGRITFRTLEDRGNALPAAKSASLSASTAPIAGVVIRGSSADVGVRWPEDAAGELYPITGNLLLTAMEEGELLEAAQALYDRVAGLSYAPLRAEVFGSSPMEPGELVTAEGITAAVFSVKREEGLTILESTGSESRESAAALAARDPVTVVQGKMGELELSIEGFTARLSATELTAQTLSQEVSEAAQTASGITARVTALEETAQSLGEQTAEMALRADSLEVSVSAVTGTAEQTRDQMAGLTERFRFDQTGLTITNSASSMGIGISEERVVFTGGEETSTVIYPNRMETAQLSLGSFSFIPRTNGNLSLRYTGQ